jgi:cyanophycinase
MIVRNTLSCLVFASLALADDRPARPHIDPAGVKGELLLAAGEVPVRALTRFVERAGGDKARILVLVAGKETLSPRLRKLAGKSDDAKVEVRSVTATDDGSVPDFADLGGVWIVGDDVPRLRKAIVGTALEKGCREVLARGGIVAGSGLAAGLLTRIPVEGTAKGCDLLPDAIVELGVEAKASKLSAALKANPGHVGYSIGSGGVLVVRSRRLAAIGSGKVSAVLGATATREERRIPLGGDQIEDSTTLRRAARDRADGFPPAKGGKPVVAKGTLVIIGGGGMPRGMIAKFVELAGGKEAKIVVLPTAVPGATDPIAGAFTKAGAKKVTTLPGITLAEVEGKESLAALKEATGIWFGGGRQWRFVDAYENTKAVPLMFDVLARGGVIGGSSAGATIQGEYLARGGVFDNFAPMYEGYERGLSFLPGVAIDQHFAQRKRFADMTSLVKAFPRYLGIGLDEATAIVVRGNIASVEGRGKVHFYDAKKKLEKGKPDHESLGDGERYDLEARKVLPPVKKK